MYPIPYTLYPISYTLNPIPFILNLKPKLCTQRAHSLRAGNWMQLVRFMRGALRKRPRDVRLFYLNDAVFTRAKARRFTVYGCGKRT